MNTTQEQPLSRTKDPRRSPSPRRPIAHTIADGLEWISRRISPTRKDDDMQRMLASCVKDNMKDLIKQEKQDRKRQVTMAVDRVREKPTMKKDIDDKSVNNVMDMESEQEVPKSEEKIAPKIRKYVGYDSTDPNEDIPILASFDASSYDFSHVKPWSNRDVEKPITRDSISLEPQSERCKVRYDGDTRPKDRKRLLKCGTQLDALAQIDISEAMQERFSISDNAPSGTLEKDKESTSTLGQQSGAYKAKMKSSAEFVAEKTLGLMKTHKALDLSYVSNINEPMPRDIPNNDKKKKNYAPNERPITEKDILATHKLPSVVVPAIKRKSKAEIKAERNARKHALKEDVAKKAAATALANAPKKNAGPTQKKKDTAPKTIVEVSKEIEQKEQTVDEKVDEKVKVENEPVVENQILKSATTTDEKPVEQDELGSVLKGIHEGAVQAGVRLAFQAYLSRATKVDLTYPGFTNYTHKDHLDNTSHISASTKIKSDAAQVHVKVHFCASLSNVLKEDEIRRIIKLLEPPMKQASSSKTHSRAYVSHDNSIRVNKLIHSEIAACKHMFLMYLEAVKDHDVKSIQHLGLLRVDVDGITLGHYKVLRNTITLDEKSIVEPIKEPVDTLEMDRSKEDEDKYEKVSEAIAEEKEVEKGPPQETNKAHVHTKPQQRKKKGKSKKNW